MENKSDGAIAGAGDFYAWGLEDSNDLKLPNDLRAVGVQSFASGPTNRLIVFAISSWHRWSNAAHNRFDIRVDVDQDGVDDYLVRGHDAGFVGAGAFTGIYDGFVFNLRTGLGSSLVGNMGVLTDNSTLFIQTVSTQFCTGAPPSPCLSATNPRFAYTASSFDSRTGAVDSMPGNAKFNAWTPAITTGGFVTVNPGQTGTTPIAINPTEWALTPAKGIMVLSTDNQSGKDEAALLEMKLN